MLAMKYGEMPSQSWAAVMPRFMNRVNDTEQNAQHDLLVEQLLSIDREDRKFYAKNKSGKMVVLGLDTLAFQLATLLGRSRLCSELVLLGEPIVVARKNAQYIQQLCVLSGSTTQVAGGFDAGLLQRADFILHNVKTVIPHAILNEISKEADANPTRSRLIVYGDSASLQDEIPTLAESFPQFFVVGIACSDNAEGLDAIQEYLESVLFQRPFVGLVVSAEAGQ